MHITVNDILAGFFLKWVLTPHNDRTTGLSNAVPFDIYTSAYSGACGVLIQEIIASIAACKPVFEPSDRTDTLAAVFSNMTEAKQTANRNKAPFHRGEAILNVLAILHSVTIEQDPERRFQKAVDVWSETHVLGEFNYNTDITAAEYLTFQTTMITADRKRAVDLKSSATTDTVAAAGYRAVAHPAHEERSLHSYAPHPPAEIQNTAFGDESLGDETLAHAFLAFEEINKIKDDKIAELLAKAARLKANRPTSRPAPSRELPSDDARIRCANARTKCITGGIAFPYGERTCKHCNKTLTRTYLYDNWEETQAACFSNAARDETKHGKRPGLPGTGQQRRGPQAGRRGGRNN